MIPDDTIGRTVSYWFHADAEHRIPDHLEAILERTGRERQRPAWSSRERWLPMETTFSGRLAPAFRPTWVVLALVLVLALAAAAFLAGSRQRPLPAPFGPAANGLIFYVADGDIYRANPDGSDPQVVVGGPGDDLAVLASRDGTRIAIARRFPGQRSELLIADANGRDVRLITPTPLRGLSSADWSPDDTRLAVTDASANSLSIMHADGSATREIRLGVKPEQVFWRPDGSELVVRGWLLRPGIETQGFFVVRADGTGFREVVALSPDNGSAHGAMSPDGSQILFTQWDGDAPPGGHLYVVDVDSGEKRLLVFDGDVESDYFATWSPDGSHIVFNQGTAQDRYFVAVAPADGGHAKRLGEVMPWSDAAETAFSPDGSKVIARYTSGATWIFDVTDGSARQLHATIPILPSWQRIATEGGPAAPSTVDETTPCPGGGCR
jgi:hypothetical protein